MVIQVLFLIEETIITINFEDNRIDFQLCTSVQIPKEEKQKGGWDGSGRSSSSSGREWRSRPGARAGRWGSGFSIIVPLMFFYCSESCCLPAWHMSVCQDEVCAAIEMEPCSGPFIYMGILAICNKNGKNVSTLTKVKPSEFNRIGQLPDVPKAWWLKCWNERIHKRDI